jgi:hypothetical protein
VHGGRIDTLGIDENGCPVIVEYKRATNENVVNQGLFYLDWLMDHRGEFELLTLKRLGKEASDGIEWKAPRLLCIAGDFTKYDAHAVQQMNRNIGLVRYQKYGDELLLLELVNAVRASVPDDDEQPEGASFWSCETDPDHVSPFAKRLREEHVAKAQSQPRPCAGSSRPLFLLH